MATQRIVPNVWCQGNAEEAGEYYARVLPDTQAMVESRYPEEGLPEFQRGLAGKPLTVALDIRGYRVVLINAGDEFSPNASISFMLNFDPLFYGGDEAEARAHLGATWRDLNEGGTELMPLGEYPFSKRYGWVQDRFGVHWQLMLTDPTGDPRPFVIPALMFDGASQDQAAQAADEYVALFASLPGGAEVGLRSPYGAPTGAAGADALAFGEFRVGEQWLVASDNGSGQDHGFTCGVSLEVRCADQAEIDRVWGALSVVPAAEQCGWLQDRYGVSWQVVPKHMAELMQRPDAFAHLMGMRKIVIDDV